MLIQKDVKPFNFTPIATNCLRALLIQKDVKPIFVGGVSVFCLRALLIQKDVKQDKKGMNWQSV